MATYVPNATQTTEPTEDKTVESAALEFRTLKTRTNTLETTVVGNLATLQAADALETTTRIAEDTAIRLEVANADAAIVDYISPYIDELSLVNFPDNFDLGFVYDPVAPTNVFDMGSI